MKIELIDIIPTNNSLGEGVTWDPRTGCVLWTDINEKKLYRLHFESRKYSWFSLPDRLGSFGLTEDVDVLICAFSDRFALYNYHTQTLSDEVIFAANFSGLRMNDGRLDPQGRFWAGSMVENIDNSPPTGAGLYSMENGIVKNHLSNIEISNGLCWNGDGNFMYFTDTPKRQIDRYDFEQKEGLISNKTLFVNTPPGAYPDGAIIDRENHLWSAHWGAGQVVRYNPEGQVDTIIEMPISQPTCLTFGGPHMDIIFVTSAHEKLDHMMLKSQPEAGNLFIYRSAYKGIIQKKYYSFQSGKVNE